MSNKMREQISRAQINGLFLKSYATSLLGEALAFVGIVGAMAILAWQVYAWAKSGTWVPVSILDLLLRITRGTWSAWLRAPDDWIGLHGLLVICPAHVPLVALGVLGFPISHIGGVLLQEAEAVRERHERRG
jgi:hypothetical protein